jgi:Zn-dependent M28 family amino/carboxypeptidase
LLCACQREAPAPAAAPTVPKVLRTVTTPPEGTHRFDPAINTSDFAWHVQTLASDEFEGRGPGTLGERLTTTYLQQQFERIGLKPGNGTSFLQSVPMLSVRTEPATTLAFHAGEQALALTLGQDYVLSSRGAKGEVALRDNAVVFAGYGIVAPEWQWDDYAGIDVRGKTVVVLVNDPGLATKDPKLFKGENLTYYGRWTYKYEEAARHGAAACLIVHDSAGAAYDWSVVRSSWGGERHFLPPEATKDPHLQLEGWLSGESAAKLMNAAGQDLAKLRQAAATRGFAASELALKLDAALHSSLHFSRSDNVVALLPGATKPDEALVYSAHWDHLGRHAEEGGDNIYNGARDNGSGVAGVLEIAEAFAQQQPRPARSLLFLLTTLEESNLLGSQYYVEHPIIPLKQTVAAINLDDLPIHGRSRDIALIGAGESDLDELLAEVAKTQDRSVVPEAAAALSGFFFRSDQFNFARHGIPVLYARGGVDLRSGGIDAGKADAADYVAHRYHKPADQFSPDWDLGGIVEDVQALYAVGQRVAAGEVTPQLKPGAEFAPAPAH